MAYSLLFWPDADESMTRLENDPSMASALRAVRRTLGRLEVDPSHPRLGTRQFLTATLGHVRATPAQEGDWYVFWQPSAQAEMIEIIQIAEAAI